MQITSTWLYRSRVLGTQYSVLGYHQFGKVSLPPLNERTGRPEMKDLLEGLRVCRPGGEKEKPGPKQRQDN